MNKKEIFFLILIIFTVSLLIIIIPRYISIKEINCINQYGSCNVAISNSISEVEKGNLIDTKKRFKKLLSENIFVKEYRLHFSYPDKLVISLIERNPNYALTDSLLTKYLLLDSKGLILSAEEKTNLPTLVINENNMKPGDRVNQNQLFALQIIRSIYSNYPPKLAKIDNASLLVELEDDLKIIFPLEGDKDVLVGSAFFILSKLKKGEVGERNISIIDLRYKSPVISLK